MKFVVDVGACFGTESTVIIVQSEKPVEGRKMARGSETDVRAYMRALPRQGRLQSRVTIERQGVKRVTSANP